MFNKVVVWGVPLHQHTNSYVYAGFDKAFKHLGYDSYWLNAGSTVSGMDFSNTLFITEGQHDGNIPLRNDCKYVLHNCCAQKYQEIKPENRLALQVYTNDVFKHGAKKINDQGSYFLGGEGRCLFQPWATDLLQHEINLNDVNAPRTNVIHWCGTVGGGEFGNINEIDSFRKAAESQGISFVFHGPGSTSFEDNRKFIRDSYLAPAIHGTWQARVGYIACRVFKNVSYGQAGLTNSKEAFELFDGNAVFNSDPSALFFDGVSSINDKTLAVNAMKLVRDKHTYVNRIETILDVFEGNI